MSTKETIRFGDDVWKRGTRGLTNAANSDRPVIRNMRLGVGGSLEPRPLWKVSECSIDPIFNTHSVIFPAQYNYLGLVTEGFVVVDAGRAEFVTETGTTYAEDATNTDVRSKHDTIVRISDSRWLVMDTMYNLRQDSVVGGVKPLNAQQADVATDFSLFAWGVEGSCVHQGRAFYWGSGSSAVGTPYPNNRVYYSNSIITDGYDGYVTFDSADQFFDVDGEVKGCVSVGPNLMIWTREGRWFMMQGSGDPANATFNNLGLAKIPGDGRWPTQVDRSAIFLSSDLLSVVTIDSSGQIDERSLSPLGFSALAIPYTEAAPANIAASSLQNSTMMPYYIDTARHLWNGVWTDEEWTITTYAAFQIWSDEINSREMLAIFTPGATPQWKIYLRDLTETLSPSAAGDYSEYEEDYTGQSAGYVQLPRLFKPFNQVRVLKVVIDGEASSASNVPDPTFEVHVNDGKGTDHTLSIGPGDVFNDVDGPVRVVASGEMPFTHFSDVSIEKLAGFKIDAVTVEIEVSKGLVQ